MPGDRLQPRGSGITQFVRGGADDTAVVTAGGVGHRSNRYSITVDVDVGRGHRGPCEIHRVPPLHPAPVRTERDCTRGWRDKSTNFIVVGDVDASARNNARIKPARAGHQLVRAAAGIDNVASVSSETVQPLVPPTSAPTTQTIM